MGLATLDEVIDRLRSAHWKERDAIKAELIAAAQAVGDVARVVEHLEAAKKSLNLELRWELDEVLEAVNQHWDRILAGEPALKGPPGWWLQLKTKLRPIGSLAGRFRP